MCGRYASSRKPDDLIELFGIEDVVAAEPLEPDYNVAPTKPVYAVLTRPPRGAQGEEAAAVRQLRVVTWGLVPSWAPGPAVAGRHINARVETVASKPAFRSAFAARRCLLPADGYFEWYADPDSPAVGRPRKQPYFIHPRDGGVLAMAGVYELWRDPARGADDPQRWLWTAAVITTTAEDEIGHLHDRMPLLVPQDRYDAWLDPRPRDPADLTRLLVPAAPGRLAAHPVSTAVNHVANNGPHLVEPVAPEAAVARLF